MSARTVYIRHFARLTQYRPSHQDRGGLHLPVDLDIPRAPQIQSRGNRINKTQMWGPSAPGLGRKLSYNALQIES